MDIELRPLSIEKNVNRYAEGSALVRMGNTHVLCTASVEETVPGWMEGKGRGWVTGEYSMLPRSTHTRTKRDRNKISGRTQEIQRLIGRALRAAVRLDQLGERTITVDCDVLQADGGTRTASINGGCVALSLAINKLRSEGKIQTNPFSEWISGISVGLRKGQLFVDLDYEKDSSCDVDMNFVITQTGKFVEIQGTAEKESFTPEQMGLMTQAALAAAKKIQKIQIAAVD